MHRCHKGVPADEPSKMTSSNTLRIACVNLLQERPRLMQDLSNEGGKNYINLCYKSLLQSYFYT